jgi:hypothetical protein
MSEWSTDSHQGVQRCEIRIKGHLDRRWAVWFDGLTPVTEPDGTTVLAGPVVDQAALHGLLQKVRDIGLPLISVTCTAPGQPGTPNPAPAQVPTDPPRSTT